MKEKFLILLIGFLAIASPIGTENSSFSSSSVLAQSSEKELNLESMDIEKLDNILQDNIENVEGQGGQWKFSLNDISIIVLADARANRMRIVAPVVSTNDLTTRQIQSMLAANFHTALDARYAVSDGVVTSAFIHPLDSLQERDFLSALNQVVSLASTFGSTYTSGELLFLPERNRERSIPSEENISI